MKRFTQGWTIQWIGQAHKWAKPLSPSRRRSCIDHVRQELSVSERRACRTLGQHRSTQRKVPQGWADEQRLTDDIIELADQYGRYGYRMVTGLLNNAGWCVNHKRVERRAIKSAIGPRTMASGGAKG